MPRQTWNHDQIGHGNGVLGAPMGHGADDQYFAGDAPSQYGTDIEPVMEMGFWVPRWGMGPKDNPDAGDASSDMEP